MIVPHAGCADAAEWQSVLRDVHERFVHADAAGQCGLQHVPLLRARIRTVFPHFVLLQGVGDLFFAELAALDGVRAFPSTENSRGNLCD